MAKKLRFNGAIEAFASGALGTERTVFGGVLQSDAIADNVTASYIRGWGIVGVNDLPTKQDFSACAYTISYETAYLYQWGVAEYNATQDYHTNQITNYLGVLYKSLQDNNTGNTPSTFNSVWWKVLEGRTNNMVAVTSPAVGNDNTQGYTQLSIWYNTVTGNLWRCVDASTGAAVWKQDSLSKNNLTSVVAPVVGNDVTQGYTATSVWYNTATGLSYICVDATTGAAVWKQSTANAAASNTDSVGTTTGGTTVYAITTTPTFAALTTGQVIWMKMNATSTGVVTVNPNAIGATTTVDEFGNAFSATNVLLINRMYPATYDGAKLVVDTGNTAPTQAISNNSTLVASTAYADRAAATIPQNSKSANYTVVLADAGAHILHPTADNNARTFTIDSNANVAYIIGTTLTFVNQINTLTIAITADTLTMAGTGSTGSRTLAANSIATAVKITATSWIISGQGLT